MKTENEFVIFELSNGLRVVHKQVNRPVAHCGLMINAGTRDELADEHGLSMPYLKARKKDDHSTF